MINKEEILKTLNNNFETFDLQDVYTEKNVKIKVKCKKCEIVFTKTLNHTLNSECRNCNMKLVYLKRKEKEIFAYDEIYDFYKSKSGYVVKFTCKKCGQTHEKLFHFFKINQMCNTCSYKKTSLKRENKRLSKKDRVIISLNEQNISFDDFIFNTVYDNINIHCKTCDNMVNEKIYRVTNMLRSEKQFLCKDCIKKRKIKLSAYNLVKFYQKNKTLGEKIGFLYMYQITTDTDEGYKIGITRNTIEGRINKVRKLYNIQNIYYIEDSNLNNAILERKLKQKYSNFKILPNKKFEGYTECFTKPILLIENLKVQRLS